MQQTPSQMNMAPSIPTANITTEQIQKLLEENKKLIVAILENQNLGKLAECAQFQAQLQKNLMYLAAIADAQPPQPATPTSQTPPHSAAQQGNFMQNPEAATTQQQQGMFAAKSPFQLNDQQQQQQLQQQQQQQYQQQQQHQQQQPQQHQQPQQQQQHHPQQQQQHHQQPQQHQHQQQQQQQQPQQLHFLQQHQQLPFLQQQHQLPFLQQQQLFQSPLGMRHGATSAMHQAMQSGYGGLSSLMAAQGNRQDGSETPSGDGQGKSASGRGD